MKSCFSFRTSSGIPLVPERYVATYGRRLPRHERLGSGSYPSGCLGHGKDTVAVKKLLSQLFDLVAYRKGHWVRVGSHATIEDQAIRIK